ncbi:unnamed protein product [Amoebophrya sp. A25]|nr:unnamed protein product [Amoebophrya sp. A25]|eukprot:GSA25T00023855001.1
MQEIRDERSRLITEYVKCVRLVKLSENLEILWYQRLRAARTQELEVLRRMRFLQAFNVFMGSFFNFLLPTTIFTIYVLQGHELTGAVVFTTLAWIQH